MPKVKVYMESRVTFRVDKEMSREDAAELRRLAKAGQWKDIGEWFDSDQYIDQSEVEEDSIELSIDGKAVYQDD